MARGSVRSGGSSGEDLMHFNAVRIRVNGTGTLLLKAFSLDDKVEYPVAPLEMSPKPGLQPTLPMNVIGQRISLEMTTTNFADYFKINRIIIFSRFYATSVPQ